MASIVRDYLTQDLNDIEKISYIRYVKYGDEKSTDWIEKTSARREPLLLLHLKCQHILYDGGPCNSWINIKETGVCKCTYGHDGYDVVLSILKKLD
jgi:hypothetical protein